MGLLPKYKIEELKREKREAKAAKKRKENTRSKIVRFLIVCEGSRTEPNYFQALVRDRYSEVRDEKIVGEGKSTCALVKRTLQIKEELERKRQLTFDRVWVVFDRMILWISMKLSSWRHPIRFKAHGRMKPLNFGISCIFNIWMQASAAMTTLKNCKAKYENILDMKTMNTRRMTLLFIRC